MVRALVVWVKRNRELATNRSDSEWEPLATTRAKPMGTVELGKRELATKKLHHKGGAFCFRYVTLFSGAI